MNRAELALRRSFLPAAAAALLAAMPAGAPALAGPAAIVEDVKGKIDKLDVMDYVEPGQVVQLKAGEVLVLGYLKSCVRETIQGGKVTVGLEQSQVEGGKVERAKFACDGGKLQLTAEQAGKSGAMVFRKKPTDRAAAAEAPQVIIYSSIPAVAASAPGELLIERLDRAGQPVTVRMTAARMDLAKAGVRLDPGGTYRATLAGRKVVFAVDAKAAPGAGPLAGRLIQF
ncbi:MAG: hypothetical protein ACT4N4_06025 [Rhodospirillales bacterium]